MGVYTFLMNKLQTAINPATEDTLAAIAGGTVVNVTTARSGVVALAVGETEITFGATVHYVRLWSDQGASTYRVDPSGADAAATSPLFDDAISPMVLYFAAGKATLKVYGTAAVGNLNWMAW